VGAEQVAGSMVSGCFGFCHNNHDPSRRGRHLKLLSTKALRRRMKPPVGAISCKSQIWCRKVFRGNGLRRKSFRVSRTDVKWLCCKGLWLGAESFARWGGCESACGIADHTATPYLRIGADCKESPRGARVAGRSEFSKYRAGTRRRAAATGRTTSRYTLGRRFSTFIFGHFEFSWRGGAGGNE
jgi:hypothetical protein